MKPRERSVRGRSRAFIDLHCHTSASFDSLASPAAVVRAATARGITHLAITDHDRIDGALEAQAAAAHQESSLKVLVGQEIRTQAGDMIGVFLTEAVPPGLAPEAAIAAVREQGGLIGIAHPFDRFRGSLGKGQEAWFDQVAGEVDWIEAWNARLILGDYHFDKDELDDAPGVEFYLAAASAETQERAERDGHWQALVEAGATPLPPGCGTCIGLGVGTIKKGEVGISSTGVRGDPSMPDGLRAALAGQLELVTGHASAYVRLTAPAAKLLQHARGRGRVKPVASR